MLDSGRRTAMKLLGGLGAVALGSTTAAAQGKGDTPAGTARLDFRNQTADATGVRTVTVDRAYLPDGGRVVIHDAAGGAGFGAVRGISAELGRGTNNDVEVDVQPASETTAGLVAMAHRSGTVFEDPVGDDTAGVPYFAAGAPVVDLAVVT